MPAAARAFALFCAASLVLFGRDVVLDPANRVVGDDGPDKSLYLWSLVWWPLSLVRGWNPLHAHVAWAPDGIDFGWMTIGAGLSLAAAPLTAAAGPVVAYNVLALLAPATAATTAFLLCHRLTRRFWPSLLGGYLYGFSSYVLGHMVGHLLLVWVALVPVAAHLALRRLAGELGSRRVVLALAAVFVGQFLIVGQLLFSLVLIGALALLSARIVLGRELPLGRLALEAAAALGVGGVVLLPFALSALFAAGTGALPYRSTFLGSADVLNYVVPTRLTWLRFPNTDEIADRFTSTSAEQGAYLGPALLAVFALYVLRPPFERPRLLLGVVFGAIAILSLGPRVKIAGDSVAQAPWELLKRLPLMGSALPIRFTLYTSLVVAVAVALWLAERPAAWRWGLALVGAVCLLPNPALGLWSSHVPRVGFFEEGEHEWHIGRDDIALVLPYGPSGWSMYWQAQTGMRFRMVGGYFALRVLPDEEEWRDVYERLGTGRFSPERLCRSLAAHDVDVVVVAPGTQYRMRETVAEALDVEPTEAADALVYRLSLSSTSVAPSRPGSGRSRCSRRPRPRRSRRR